jgi:hypothetical protein
MNRFVMIPFSALLLAAVGCARQVTPVAAPTARVVAAPAPAVEPTVSVPTPVGWLPVPIDRSMTDFVASIRNEEMGALVLVRLLSSDHSAAEDATRLASSRAMGSNAVVGMVHAAKDEQSARFSFSDGFLNGAITVRRLGWDRHASLVFIGMWVKTNDDAAKSAYVAVVNGTTVR